MARALEGAPGVARVLYPGLASHPQHELATRTLRDGMAGGMLAVELAGGRRHGERFLERVRVARPRHQPRRRRDAWSAIRPAPVHRQLDDDELAAAGLSPGMVRVSVGLEDEADLIEDLVGAARPRGMTPSRVAAAATPAGDRLARGAGAAPARARRRPHRPGRCCCSTGAANAVAALPAGRTAPRSTGRYAILLGALALSGVAAVGVRAPTAWREWRRPTPVQAGCRHAPRIARPDGTPTR